MSELYEHWCDDTLRCATPQQVVAGDQRFFGELDEAADIEVIGLDQAESAIAFAEESGLLDTGLTLNLESEPLPALAKKNWQRLNWLPRRDVWAI